MGVCVGEKLGVGSRMGLTDEGQEIWHSLFEHVGNLLIGGEVHAEGVGDVATDLAVEFDEIADEVDLFFL